MRMWRIYSNLDPHRAFDEGVISTYQRGNM
jgi:hypothetical protein